MKRERIKELPIYPEQRLCKRPTTEQILRLFSLAERHTLLRDDTPVQSFPAQLTDLQRQTLDLLGVPERRVPSLIGRQKSARYCRRHVRNVRPEASRLFVRAAQRLARIASPSVPPSGMACLRSRGEAGFTRRDESVLHSKSGPAGRAPLFLRPADCPSSPWRSQAARSLYLAVALPSDPSAPLPLFRPPEKNRPAFGGAFGRLLVCGGASYRFYSMTRYPVGPSCLPEPMLSSNP